jgi:hypothetical protein
MRRIICDVTNGRVNFEYEDIREFDYHGPLCRDKAGERIDEATWRVVHDQFSEPDVVLSIKPATVLWRHSGRFRGISRSTSSRLEGPRRGRPRSIG